MNLFVYGTLLPELRHPLGLGLADAGRAGGTGSVPGRLFHLGEYPGAVPSERSGDRVQGKVFWLDSDHALWREMDAYEGYDPVRPDQCEFYRVEATASMDTGKPLPVWIYWYRGPTSESAWIAGGDYLKFLKSQHF